MRGQQMLESSLNVKVSANERTLRVEMNHTWRRVHDERH